MPPPTRLGVRASSGWPGTMSLEPAPRYEMIVAASGGYGERVEAAGDLPAAMGRALDAITSDRRQALLNVVCR